MKTRWQNVGANKSEGICVKPGS